MERGIDPARLAVIGLGEFRPIADNTTEVGRNMNRRVLIVILSNGVNAEGSNTAAQPLTESTTPIEPKLPQSVARTPIAAITP
jgi:chemotaxis protein MotB